MPTGFQVAQKAREAYRDEYGYIWGASGQLWTAAKQAAATREMTVKYGSRWIGHHVLDCSGLFVWAGVSLGISNIPHGSNSQFKRCISKGLIVTIQTLPVGALVFKAKGTDFYHVGIYLGDGEVVEAQGTKTGVVLSKLSEWSHFGLYPGITYDKTGETKEVTPMGTMIVDVPNDGTVNVRQTPSTSGKKLDTLPEGNRVEVLAASGDWAKVRYTREGFVMTKFLREV